MRRTLIALILFPLSQTAFSQPVDTVALIDKIFSSWNNATPGGSVLVARGTNILYQKAYGLANMESNVPNTVNTIFEAGSVSKQFTAYSILLLEGEGRLKISDDVRKYIPELPSYEAPITIQHLLNHTSGLKDWGSIGALTGWPRGSRDYTLDLALHIICKQKTTNLKPGSEYSYSNSNYTLLVAIVERVSKQSLESVTAERLFKPLAMNNTRWRSNFRTIVPGRAQAYSKWSGDSYELEMPFEHIHDGGLLTTTEDLLKWNQLLAKHDALYTRRIERGKLNDGSAISYAAGVQHGEVNSVAEIAHSGSTAGYRAWLAYYPSKRITITILSNDAHFANVDVGHKIAEVYFGSATPQKSAVVADPVVKKRTLMDLSRYVGDYYSDEAECTLRVTVSDGSLLITNDALKTYRLPDNFEFQVSKNKVTGLNVAVSRANNILFKKITK